MEEVEQFDDISIEELAEGMHWPSRRLEGADNLHLLLQNFLKTLLDTLCSLTSSSTKMEEHRFL